MPQCSQSPQAALSSDWGMDEIEIHQACPAERQFVEERHCLFDAREVDATQALISLSRNRLPFASRLAGLRDGRTIGSRVRRGGVHLRLSVVHDRVPPAHPGAIRLGDGNLVPL